MIFSDTCKKSFLLFALLLGIAQLAQAKDAQIHDVRLWRAPDSTRIVFDLDQGVDYKVFTLQNPDRVVIDIPHAVMMANLGSVDLKNSPIVSLRSGSSDKDVVRIVMDVAERVIPQSFFLKKNGTIGDRLVVDLKDTRVHQAEVTKTVAAVNDKRRDLIIAVDAGHGGEDPGALGASKVQEKKIVFAIAQELAALLGKETGYQVVMVRKGDYYVGLKERREIASKARADLFVSIHADAFRNPKAHGSSVYALSPKGASSAEAQYLADSENQSDLVGGLELEDKDPVLASVFFDLSMTYKRDSSLMVGGSVLNKMKQISRLHSFRVEQAAFAVLKAPDVPSILVETGFVSNPGEARKLNSPEYQKKVASAIFDGIHDYFRINAPEDTYIAWKNKKPNQDNVYVVTRGDTLSGIASRYSISMNELRSYNSLNSNEVRIGQKIRIPVTN